MRPNWLEKSPEERRDFAKGMVEIMLGLGYEATFEQAWIIVADDDLCEKYYDEADAQRLANQRGQMITMVTSILDTEHVKGQRNKYD